MTDSSNPINPGPSAEARERGNEVTRLEAFVDAAFAFAVTLLVISIDSIPDSIPALIDALKGIPAFAASFSLIAFFWHQHARWSRRYGLDDGVTTFLSLLLVFLVLVYVYPLRMLFGSLFAWISGGHLPAGFRLNGFNDLRWMFGVYAVAWATLGLVIAALQRHAWSLRDSLQLNRFERIRLRGDQAHSWVVPSTGLLSLLVAVLMPATDDAVLLGLPGFVYGLMALGPVVKRRAQQRAERLEP